jgi:hypothetical protein
VKGRYKMAGTIPCDFCNMIAQDKGVSYEDLESVGAIRNGKMKRHFANCPEGMGDGWKSYAQKEKYQKEKESKEDDSCSLWSWFKSLFNKG